MKDKCNQEKQLDGKSLKQRLKIWQIFIKINLSEYLLILLNIRFKYIYSHAVSQTMIKRYVHWNEDIGEWQLKCVAYTGNNMRKAQTASPAGNNKDVKLFILITFYNILYQ